MVDEARLMRLLRGVTDDVSILRDRAATGAEVRNLESLGDLDDFVDSVVRWVGGEVG